MVIKQPVPVYRQDYKEFSYNIASLQLEFQLREKHTTVISIGKYIKKTSADDDSLLLFGEQLDLLSLSINDEELANEQYSMEKGRLVIAHVPDIFTLKIITRIFPANNTSLQGLYLSSGNYCTQCEAQGFRRITYYPDRPDVLTVFTTRIEADKNNYPRLLSNGNLIETGDAGDGRHYALWHDPFPKPSYLFALVAGDLVCISDSYRTASGKEILLNIFVESRNRDRCRHAMESLKQAMRWDENIYGLEYDLDTYMIVAVDDFNMGAMENKGLNIFNSKYVLSSQETATDLDYLGIQGVIAHEYFHNWTGNRVTCRDWFQLSLKEGLTVFRDQEFSADMNSRPVKRIEDVKVLRNFQFKEDSGPMAHPVRPDSYVEINNFYTATVYNKGAEVIRMMQTILGHKKFRLGIELYFQRHDGQAVTCDDFVMAMEDASGIDLNQFKNWYSQAGTPVLHVAQEWHDKSGKLQLRIGQTCPDTPGQKDKLPFTIPIKIGLIDEEGRDLLADQEDEQLLLLEENEQLFTFENITSRPVLSFLRDFSAPVKVMPFQSRADLSILMKFDTNLYNRWEACTSYATKTIMDYIAVHQEGGDILPDEQFLEAVSYTIRHHSGDAALLAHSLQLPQETILAQEMETVDPEALHLARQKLLQQIAENNREKFLDIVVNHQAGEYSLAAAAMGKRSLRNVALTYLMALEEDEDFQIVRLCAKQYYDASNMTDRMAALRCLTDADHAERENVLADFYGRWQSDPLTLDKWFAVQALSRLPSTLDRVKELTQDPQFSFTNPNKVRSLIGTFCAANHVRFHDKGGDGYKFLTGCILQLDPLNPQIAARLVSPLIGWRRYDQTRQALMQKELQRIVTTANISNDVYEIASKGLGDGSS